MKLPSTLYAPTFTRVVDDEGVFRGIEINGDWPRILEVSDGFLMSIRDDETGWAKLSKDDTELTFELLNGRARYRLLGYHEDRRVTVWEGID